MILVDSSVWIDLLHDVQTPQTLTLRGLLPRREAALTAVVYQEILQGAATPDRFTKLKRYFRTLSSLAEAAKEYPGIVVRGHSIDFGSLAKFETNSSVLTAAQSAMLRDFVPKVVLSKVRDPLGQKWLKRIVVEGFADQRGTYIHNLNLSLQRSERVLCVLLASPKSVPNALTDADRLSTRELFLVGGSSFNALKAIRRRLCVIDNLAPG